MNQYHAWELVSLYLIVAFSVTVIIYTAVRIIREKRRRRKVVLRNIKDNISHFLRNHAHLSPVHEYVCLEEVVKSYKYTDEELGVPLKILLGHAVLCQQSIVDRRQKNILEFTMGPNQNMTLEYCENARNLLNDLDAARDDYKTINEQWIRANGMDPKSVHRWDPPKPLEGLGKC